MRLTIPQPQLLKHLQTVERAVNDRSTLPILANVLLETTEEELLFTATDLDIGIQCRFPLMQPVERGAVTLPARKLTTIIRELPDEPVTIETKKNHTATVTCGTTNFKLPGLPPEDFPALPTPQPAESITLPQATLKALIDQTAYAMSTEENRFILNGALFAAAKDQSSLVATDGRRLAVASAPMTTAPKQPFRAVIPSKTIRELGRTLQDDPDDVTIAALKDNQLTFQFGAVVIITRLLEGQFPPYEKVVPAPSKTAVTCNLQALWSAVRRANLMTTATSQAVVFEVDADRLVISKETSELGSVHEEVAAAYTGEPMTVAFNPSFWLEMFKTIATDEVTIELSGPDRPAVVRRPGFTYVVLPMKVA